VCWLALCGVAWRSSRPALAGAAAASEMRLEIVVVPVALVLHAMLLYRRMVVPEGLDLGVANAISMLAWLTILIYWLASLAYPGLASILGLTAPIGLGAAVHAVVMLAEEKWLHRGELPPFLRSVPPLLEMEALLFRIILAAFVLLTLTLVSGSFFSERLFGKPFTFTDKTVFGIVSWVIFGSLLVGHYARGWRGRKAVRWTLAGFTALAIAYVGSKVVLELVLAR
jgi:ABC-type uncharacterized transport system permease subunit